MDQVCGRLMIWRDCDQDLSCSLLSNCRRAEQPVKRIVLSEWSAANIAGYEWTWPAGIDVARGETQTHYLDQVGEAPLHDHGAGSEPREPRGSGRSTGSGFVDSKGKVPKNHCIINCMSTLPSSSIRATAPQGDRAANASRASPRLVRHRCMRALAGVPPPPQTSS